MKVYLLWHSDIEDDRYVRGVFSNQEAALAELPVEPVSQGRNREHHDVCCSVEEWEVRDEAIIAPAPEPVPYDPAHALIPLGVLERIEEQLYAKTDDLLTRVLRSRRSG